MLLSDPGKTPYDLCFDIFGFPVRIHPFFWVIGLLLGGNGGLDSALVWIAALFISILVHELGHAFMIRRFGSSCRISLYGMGGLAMPGRGRPCTDREQIIISLAGPFAGFALAAAIVLLCTLMGMEVDSTKLFKVIPFWEIIPNNDSVVLTNFIKGMLRINIFWGLVNLLPVLPLDGGRVSYVLFRQRDRLYGEKKALKLSMVVAIGVVLLGISKQEIFIAILFGYLAYENYVQLNPQAGGGRSFR